MMSLLIVKAKLLVLVIDFPTNFLSSLHSNIVRVYSKRDRLGEIFLSMDTFCFCREFKLLLGMPLILRRL